MWRIKNKGAALIEATIIIPIILFIIINCIFLFLDCINDSIIVGEGYCSIYSFSEYVPIDDIKNSFDKSVKDVLVGTGTEISADTSTSLGKLDLKIKGNKSANNIYKYKLEDVKLSMEYDKCTGRLRRWQMYGDIFSE